MTSKFRDTELIFGDLSDCFERLCTQRNSPVMVRQAFGQFITLTQQLTEIMRKEFKMITGRDWEASNFKGWNAVTDLFKKLRKETYHQFPVVIHVREIQYLPMGSIFGDNKIRECLAFQGTWKLIDQFTDEIPGGIQFIEGDIRTGKPTDKVIKPLRKEHEYIFFARTEEIKKAIELAGTDNIHTLSEKCFNTLKEYFQYYKTCIKDIE